MSGHQPNGNLIPVFTAQMTICFHCNTPLVLPTDLISYQVWGVALRSGIQVLDNWNGIQIIDGGFTGNDTTLASGHNARLLLPLGTNLSIQSDVDVEWNDCTFDNNTVAGQKWSAQGAVHLSWRDPSRGLFGAFGGVGLSKHNDYLPDFGSDIRFVGGEGQIYIDNITLYGQGAYLDVVSDEGGLEAEGFFVRGVGRYFMPDDSRFQVEGLFASLDDKDNFLKYDVYQWGARFDTTWDNAPIVGSLPLFVAYRGTLRDGCFGTLPDSDTSDHTIMAGFSYHWGTNSRLDTDRRGATLDTPNAATFVSCYQPF